MNDKECPSEDEARRLLKSGLGKALQDAAAQYVLPICWIAAQSSRPIILDSGSAFAIDCGEGTFVVTAWHVYQGYLNAQAEHPDTVCRLGDLDFKPEERLIDENRTFDVATFRVASDEIRGVGKTVLTGSQRTWLPDPPQVGRGMFFVGFSR